MRLLFLFVMCMSLYTLMLGQKSQSGMIKTISLHSTILNQDREILLYTSPNIKQESDRLPTFYLLDGKVNINLLIGLVENLERAELLPPVNIVGINTYDYDREYDLSNPATSKKINFKTGGANKFSDFIDEELIPEVEKELPAGNHRVLIGHSFGGRFGLDFILNYPNVFHSAILIDPSLWWNDGEILTLIEENKRAFSNTLIYLSEAGREKESLDLFHSLPSSLQTINFKIEEFPEENHISTLPQAIFQGIKFCFFPFSELEALYELEVLPVEEIKKNVSTLSRTFNTRIYPKSRPLATFARTLTRDGKPKKAISILEYLKEYHPENIMVLNFLGEAYQENGDLEKAKQVFQQSLAIAKAKKSPMVRWIEKRLTELNKD